MDQATLQSQHAQNKQIEAGLVLSGLNQLKSSGAMDHNYAYVVTVILSQIGMNRSQNNIEDSGALQNAISKGQTQFASMQQFMALLEGNTQWDSSRNEAYWPANFEQDHDSQLQNFANAFGQFFYNTTGKNDDSSTTTTQLTVDFTLPKAEDGFAAGTKLVIDPCAGKVYANGKQVTSGAFSDILGRVQDYVKNIAEYVYGSSSYTLPTSGSTVPQFLASAMANLQTSIDQAPQSFESKCFGSGGSAITSFAGAVNTNPLITSAEELYSQFATTNNSAGTPIADDIKAVYLGGSTDQLWEDMSGMMAFWMKDKMNGQSSSTSSAPSGSQFLPTTGFDYDTWRDAINKVQYAQDNLGVKNSVRYWGDIKYWLDQAHTDLDNKNFAGAKTALANALSYLRKGNGNAILRHCTQGVMDAQGYVNTLNQPEKPVISDSGMFNSVQSALSMGASTYQSQTQQNSALVQQESSMLTSYDQIGQSIITAVNKSEQTIAGNLKSS